MHRSCQIGVFLISVIILATSARAYLRDDHNASVRVALNSIEPPVEGEALVAMCAQLPDEAPEISAIDVYQRLMKHPADYAAWVFRSTGPARTVGRMVTVQQLQHGLTGGHPEGVRKVSVAIIRDMETRLQSLPAGARQERADTLCALGLAFHLYGDSYSHQRIKNPDKMYQAGIGHLFDSSRPDLPFLSRKRYMLWKEYLASLPHLMPHSDQADMASLIQKMEASQGLACGRNGYNLLELRQLIARHLNSIRPGKRIVAFDPKLRRQGCQVIVTEQARLNAVAPAPSCEKTWSLYRDAAIEEFDAYDQAHPEAPSRAPTRAPLFKDSPFAGGPQW